MHKHNDGFSPLKITHGGLEEVLGVVVEEVEGRQHGETDDHSPEDVLLVG